MGARILVVDDNELNLKLARHVLEAFGFTVDEAGDAEQAQARLRVLPPDIILLDVGLPGMDGLSLTRKLKADQQWKAIPVIAWSAFAIVGNDLLAQAAGCDGYLTKPIDTRNFARRVASFLVAPGATPCVTLGTADSRSRAQ
jgi:CheY-like chemotaxis protein